jgi:hypothetical protein
MRFNINDKVRVKLTDHGRAVMAANHAELLESLPKLPAFALPKEDADGWSEWQLWHLMSEFGQHMINGAPLCFEATIEIPESRSEFI